MSGLRQLVGEEGVGPSGLFALAFHGPLGGFQLAMFKSEAPKPGWVFIGESMRFPLSSSFVVMSNGAFGI
jgi:hypothetical protein